MRLRKFFILVSVFLFGFTLMAGQPAEAHYLSVITNSSTAVVGESYQVNLSFTHVLPTTAELGPEALRDLEPDFGAKYFYKEGAPTIFPAFSEGEKMYSSSAPVKQTGTVLLSTSCSMEMFGKAFSKQILNAESDGWSKHAVGEDMEIVPLSDIADARVGDTIKFKVLLNDEPLAGARVEWADPASAVYYDEEEDGYSNLQYLPDPTDNDGIFSYTITHAGLNALAIENEDAATSCSLIFDAKDAAGGSGGGCNAGFGASALICLPAFLAFFVRKKRG
ncbi:MAG: DUF4198 domain-containing protein [Synergistaceae bacterium]|jgi:uncharacterized GH25 family protein|nr:DUF4198 domain-containing protein [Synergistaceae bacterium]